MKCQAFFDERTTPPVLRLHIHGAPHRRSDDVTLKCYRTCITMAARRAGIFTPISRPIYLWVEFIDPTSPDLDNLLTALYRALDGKNPTLGRHAVLEDDRLIRCILRLGILDNADLWISDKPKRVLPRFHPIEEVA